MPEIKRPVTIVTHVGSPQDNGKVTELLDVLTINRYYGWYVDVELRSRWTEIP
jgi:beta-glucuronidase